MDDTIYRQDAIDALAYFNEKSPTGRTAQDVIQELPSAQPYKEPYIIKINKPIEDNIKGKLRKIFRTQIGEEPLVLLPTDCEVIPQIIRCKDCKHRIVNEHAGEKGYLNLKAMCELDSGDPFELGRCAEDDEWFCADAERRENAPD